eukprot:TRINITY_DN51_c0_g1_i1.p1 TRINITY_DN51_c0_g1~~TRINITY_DN51_c0_g1_i1.p1  ORF type:complete len:390 (-),score=82.85 TRINITY_DN51_c0_g1_i1:11-1180(-)
MATTTVPAARKVVAAAPSKPAAKPAARVAAGTPTTRTAPGRVARPATARSVSAAVGSAPVPPATTPNSDSVVGGEALDRLLHAVHKVAALLECEVEDDTLSSVSHSASLLEALFPRLEACLLKAAQPGDQAELTEESRLEGEVQLAPPEEPAVLTIEEAQEFVAATHPEQDHSDYETRLAEKERQLQELQGQCASQELRIAELEAQLSVSEVTVESLNERQQKLEENLTSVASTFERRTEEGKLREAALRDSLNLANVEVASLQSEVAQLQEQLKGSNEALSLATASVAPSVQLVDAEVQATELLLPPPTAPALLQHESPPATATAPLQLPPRVSLAAAPEPAAEVVFSDEALLRQQQKQKEQLQAAEAAGARAPLQRKGRPTVQLTAR